MKVEYHTTVGEIAHMCDGALVSGEPAVRVRTITSDSRELESANFFIPIAGETFNGHDFIEKLINENAIVGFMTGEEKYIEIGQNAGVAVVSCPDTLRGLAKLGAAHRDTVDPFVIGVTGTNGKTTTKELIASIIAVSSPCLKSEKNYNNEIGVPFTLLRLRSEHRFAVIEMGMNHEGEIDRLTSIVRPDMAVITNVGEGHLEFLKDVEGVARAKTEIMNGMKPGSAVFINADSECSEFQQTRAMEKRLRVVTFGLSEKADVRPDSCDLGMDFVAVAMDGIRFAAPLYGLHNVYNLLAAIAVGRELGVADEKMKSAFGGFKSVGMRSEIIEKEFIIINDTYNSNPLSARYALESVRCVFGQRRRIAVLSDMLELGEASAACHAQIGKQVFENGFDLLLTWGERAALIHDGAIAAGMKEADALHFRNKQELADHIKTVVGTGDVVLVKGSRSMKMEEVVDALVR